MALAHHERGLLVAEGVDAQHGAHLEGPRRQQLHGAARHVELHSRAAAVLDGQLRQRQQHGPSSLGWHERVRRDDGGQPAHRGGRERPASKVGGIVRGERREQRLELPRHPVHVSRFVTESLRAFEPLALVGRPMQRAIQLRRRRLEPGAPVGGVLAERRSRSILIVSSSRRGRAVRHLLTCAQGQLQRQHKIVGQ